MFNKLSNLAKMESKNVADRCMSNNKTLHG